MFYRFRQIWRRLTGVRPRVTIHVYTRDSCPLCDEAWQLLQGWRNRYGYDLSCTDVDGSAELRDRYGDCVPVVLVNGKVRFRGKINPVLFHRLMAMERRRRRKST